MTTKNTYKVGDVIVDSDQIYKIYEMKEGLVYYKPLHLNDKHNSLTCSIPEANLFKAGLRRPLTEEQVEHFLIELKGINVGEQLIDYKMVKETIFLNDPSKTAPILKLLWENKGKGDVYSRTDEDLLGAIISHLADEIALVLKITPEEAKRKIEKSGKKAKTVEKI